jgi:hypothetical protein
LDFAEIFGPNWIDTQLNLFKYCVKSFGCRLCDAGQAVPQDLVELLSLAHFRTGLKITFAVNEDVLLLDKETQIGFIGKGEMVAWASKDTPAAPTGISWNEHVSWFTTSYWYLQEPVGSCGSTWIANSQYVYLGSIEPLSSEQRDELISKSTDAID